jgi:hypothetical protein
MNVNEILNCKMKNKKYHTVVKCNIKIIEEKLIPLTSHFPGFVQVL